MAIDSYRKTITIDRKKFTYKTLFGKQTFYWKDLLNVKALERIRQRKSKYTNEIVSTRSTGAILLVKVKEKGHSIDLKYFGIERGFYIANQIVESYKLLHHRNFASDKEKQLITKGRIYLIRYYLSNDSENNLKNALENLFELLRLDPYNDRVWFLGALIAKKIDSLESLPFFEHALSFTQENADYLFNYGITLYEVGAIERAKMNLLKASSINKLYKENNLVKHLSDN